MSITRIIGRLSSCRALGVIIQYSSFRGGGIYYNLIAAHIFIVIIILAFHGIGTYEQQWSKTSWHIIQQPASIPCFFTISSNPRQLFFLTSTSTTASTNQPKSRDTKIKLHNSNNLWAHMII